MLNFGKINRKAMELTYLVKKEIDAMDYESLLQRWRFSPSSDVMFHGESGKYFLDVMNEKKEALSHDQQVAISKRIGWEP